MSTKKATNGHANRHYVSWIDKFVELTKGLESAPIFRRWTAITTIAAVLQQKVWVDIQGNLYPNLYVFLVGSAGIGKSRPITLAEKIVRKIETVALSPTSTTMASLVDKLEEAKRIIPIYPPPGLEYNSLFVLADELSSFMNDFKGQNELISGLTKFFDCTPYSQSRRVGKIEKSFDRPQITILTGSTQSNLLHFIPEWAWDQGFTSRIILIYADEQFKVNPFKEPKLRIPDELYADLENIDTLIGEFGYTDDYAEIMNTWRDSGMEPEPDHPRLISYCSRRFAHLIKLTMVASVDRGNDLTLTVADFNRAQHWMLEAEHAMPEIFRTGNSTTDSKAIDDIIHFMTSKGGKVPEHEIKNFARNFVNAMQIKPTMEVMEGAGLIRVAAYDSIGTKIYEVTKSNLV